MLPSSLVSSTLEGERAEGADGRLLGEAVPHLLPPDLAFRDVLGHEDRADHAGLGPQRGEVQPVVAMAVGGLAVDGVRLAGQRGAPVLAEPVPRARRDHVMQVGADGPVRVVAVACEDGTVHENDPHIGVDDHDAAVGHQGQDGLRDLRRVAQMSQIVERVQQHRAGPIWLHRRDRA
jgi:hypothetical protein